MLDARDGKDVARRFSLGDDAVLMGPVARGEVGQVWRLSTSLGTFAVKEQFEPMPADEVREHADFQEAAFAAGVPAPAVIRADDGSAFAVLGGRSSASSSGSISANAIRVSTRRRWDGSWRRSTACASRGPFRPTPGTRSPS